jgi:hypothetical protein
MASVTLAEFRTRARQRGDFVNSKFITDAELNTFINASLTELYDLLISSRGENYYVSSYDFTTSPGSDTYPLPTDFYKLMGVDYVTSSTQSITLKTFRWQERNRFREPFYNARIYNLMYQIRNDSLVFIPTPNGNQKIKVWYIPRTQELVMDTDTFDGINGYEEYVVIDAAIKMKEKEESDTSGLLFAKQKMEERIKALSSGRDSTEPARVVDTDRSYTGYRNNAWN